MFPCPKCTSSATRPSSDKAWTEAVLRIFQFYAVRCHHCNHRFHVFTTPGERQLMREGTQDRRVDRTPAS